MKYYFYLICFSLLLSSCSKTGNTNITDLKTLGTITVAPENFRLKILGNKSVYLQPEDHFQYDNIGRVSSATDSLTVQSGSSNIYPSIATYAVNNTIPVKLDRYWIFWMNGLQSTPYLTGSYSFSSNSLGQIITISSDSSTINATFHFPMHFFIINFHFKNCCQVLLLCRYY